MTARRARVLAGIDEAGFGPLLGPLTLGWSAFRVPRGGANLWRRLARAVSADPSRDRERVIVADSKRVFSRNPRGVQRLETTALAGLAQVDPFGRWPRTPDELWGLAPRELRPRRGELARHPWYRLLPGRLPAHVDEERLLRAATRLRDALERQGIALVEAAVRPVPSGELNDSYRRTENKALTHWHVVSRAIERLWQRYAAEGLELVVDRLGGRRSYGEYVRELFVDARVTPHRETPTRSEYHVQAGERRMRLVFLERGEEHALAVALASCLAKYARELAMDAFNRFFGELQPSLRPTAGYRTDGWRWLREARRAVERSGVPPSILVRER